MKVIQTKKYAEAAALGVKEDAKSSDKIILRQAIIAELDAVSLYEQMANSATSEKVKEILLDVAKEERVHIGEFEALLDEMDDEHEESVQEGKKEVKEKAK